MSAGALERRPQCPHPERMTRLQSASAAFHCLRRSQHAARLERHTARSPCSGSIESRSSGGAASSSSRRAIACSGDQRHQHPLAESFFRKRRILSGGRSTLSGRRALLYASVASLNRPDLKKRFPSSLCLATLCATRCVNSRNFLCMSTVRFCRAHRMYTQLIHAAPHKCPPTGRLRAPATAV